MQLRLFAVRCSVRRLSKAFALWVMEVRVSTFLGVACFHERITWADRLNIPVLLTTSVALRVRTEDLPMRARIRERPSRRPVSRDPWSLQPVRARELCILKIAFLRDPVKCCVWALLLCIRAACLPAGVDLVWVLDACHPQQLTRLLSCLLFLVSATLADRG